jgi:uncharacterized protein (TIGR02677 family)
VRNGRRQDRQQLLTYASINDAPLYRAIIEIFITAADAYQTRLRLADVLAVLSEPGGWPEPVDLTELDRRLEQLCEWGNLYHERDDALTNSLAEFEGRGYVYYLTPGGEAAHAAVEALEDGLERTGGLQTAMLRHILDVLEATVVLVRTGGDDDQLFTTLEDLHASFRALTANATLFMQTVSRVLHAPALDPERFQAFKAETVAYLTTFIDDLGTLTTAICLKLADWDALPGQQVTSALRRAGAASGQRDLERPDRNVAAEYAAAARGRIAGIAAWFIGADGSAPRSRTLSAAANTAVLGILSAAERLREQLTRPSSRAEDLTVLARLFACAPTDEDAHELWRAAFGLSPSRHVALAHPDDEKTASSVSWWDAQAVEVPASLRTTGRAEAVRRATRIPDNTAAKRQAAMAERRRAEAADAEVAALLALGERPLSQLPKLTPAAFDLLVALIEIALRATPDGRGAHTAVSRDGRYRITMTPLAGTAQLRVPGRGQLTLRDYHVAITGTIHRGASPAAPREQVAR